MALAGSILKDDFILELDELQFVSVERMGVHLFLHAFFALYTLHGRHTENTRAGVCKADGKLYRPAWHAIVL